MVSAAIPRFSILRSISRAERPASTRTRVRPDSTTQALPPDPDARTKTRTKRNVSETPDKLCPTRRAKPAAFAARRRKRFGAREFGAHDRREHELRDALAALERDRLRSEVGEDD